jgi:hypothetical protein
MLAQYFACIYTHSDEDISPSAIIQKIAKHSKGNLIIVNFQSEDLSPDFTPQNPWTLTFIVRFQRGESLTSVEVRQTKLLIAVGLIRSHQEPQRGNGAASLIHSAN